MIFQKQFVNLLQRTSNLPSSVMARYCSSKSLEKCKKINYEKIGIVGVPFEKGQRKQGVGLGPKAIREAGLIDSIQEISHRLNIRDYGDIHYEALNLSGRQTVNMRMLEHVASCTKHLSEKVVQVLNDDRLCVTLGGDHAIAIGSIDGHLKHSADVAVIWVDAHADLNTNATSPSGNLHGMPVALLAKELADYWPYIPGMDWQEPIISIKNLVYIGLRSVDPYERAIIDKFNIHAFGMREVEKYGIRDVMKMALERVDPDKSKSLHVSFDIDSLDVLEAPSTGTSVRGGLTLREGIYIMEELYNTERLAAVDLVEVNPSIGTAEDVKKTVDAAIHLLVAACGNSRRGNIPDTLDFK
ncbi:arginase, hepatic-like [Topomyia yanbarensis]|uniref:arginase, hepatic-like n=1 Tax=Topomyia yanbarensis TaxID=2498891 RepID=UPI00273CC89B|nr:arginase, hepatic-like [Topomyia yanbarensis]XP_058839181.1 arginase, hepatic-like [Topomyia yanbarensis]